MSAVTQRVENDKKNNGKTIDWDEFFSYLCGRNKQVFIFSVLTNKF
jgi:hypothetical protein